MSTDKIQVDKEFSTKKAKKISSSSGFGQSMKDVGNRILDALGNLGKALQIPVAILPFAALLNRFGSLGITYSTYLNDTGIHHAGDIKNAAGY